MLVLKKKPCMMAVIEPAQTHLEGSKGWQLLLSHESENDWQQTSYRITEIAFPFALPGVGRSCRQEESNSPTRFNTPPHNPTNYSRRTNFRVSCNIPSSPLLVLLSPPLPKILLHNNRVLYKLFLIYFLVTFFSILNYI